MSTANPGSGTRRRLEVLRRPAQGWISLLLFLSMLLVVGISLADARVIEVNGADRTGSLVVVMLAAGLVGFVLGRSSLGVVRAHAIGAAAAAVVLLMIVGAAVQETGTVIAEPMLFSLDDITPRMEALSTQLDLHYRAWRDEDTVPLTATLLVLGAICWATGQFGGFSIFRYDRGGPAVMATGVLLFLNVATVSLGGNSGTLPLIPVLAIYSALAMMLLIRLQLTQQGLHWARRHIADTGEVTRLFLRSGLLFVSLAILGASSLTAMAAVGPTNIDLEDIADPFEDLADDFSHLLAIFAIEVPKEQDTTFGDEFPILDVWKQEPGMAFTAEVSGGLRGNYWWGSAFDSFDGWRWTQSDSPERGGATSQPLPSSDLPSVAPSIGISSEITVQAAALARGTVFAPTAVHQVTQDVQLRVIAEDAGRADVRFVDDLDSGDRYGATSFVHDYRRRSQTLTANQLKAAPAVYPEWMWTHYIDVNENASGPRTKAMAERIAGSETTVYEQALAVQTELQDYDYRTTFNSSGCTNYPECLLLRKAGFCQQFASTMVMVMREMGAPARIVNGYLPGTEEGGVWSVPNEALHSWVEVYFPGYGWIRFDPTPIQNDALSQTLTDFLPGEEVTTPSSGATPPPTNEPDNSPLPSPVPLPSFGPGAVNPSGGGGDIGGAAGAALGLGALAALALIVVSTLLLFRLRRLPSADASLAYRGIVSLATRLGYGPHPAQTEYEYAATLSETLPSVRDDLYLVAESRVESAYGQRQLKRDRVPGLKRAYARIRTALVRLSFRRKR